MDKETEIKTLQSLKGDTYFAQFFNSHDIDQMCENIKNDFAIELNCQFNQKASQLERINADLKKEYEGIKHNWGMSFIKAIDYGCDEEDIYKLVQDELGLDAIIKYKHKEGLKLNDKEIEYLVSKLK